MVDVTDIGERIEDREDLGTDDAGTYAYWMGQEAIAEKEERKWVKKAREIVKRYRDERPESIQSTHRFNILWSNVQTLKPTLYARTPTPDVRRRFVDGSTPAARYAATLLERCLAFACDNDEADFDTVMKAVVEDRLLPGRAVARVLYVPHFGEPMEEGEAGEQQPQGVAQAAQVPAEGQEAAASADGDEDNEEFQEQESAPAVVDNAGDDEKDAKSEPVRPVVYEEVVAKYIFWEDYREGPARQWNEVPWVRYKSYLTRDELIERFGSAKGKQVNLDYTPKGMSESVKNEPPPDLYKKAVVHEYWDKAKKQAIWLAPGTPDMILDEKDDPLELPDFFPNPDPLLANPTNDRRIPVPDYIQYHDQARELDSITARIDRLTRALKVSGVYPGEEKQVLQQLVDEGTENRLIPVGDWTNWSDKGGLSQFVQWMPIQQVAETLIQLYAARDKTKAILYEITGIGDIMRGMTSPDETLGAQELKAVFSTRRITPQQKDVAKFARNLLRLMAGVIAVHFSEKTISMITGYPQLAPVPQMPMRPQAPPAVIAEMAQMQAAQQAQSAPAMQGGPAPQGPPGGNVVPMPGAPGQAPQAPPQPSPALQAYQQAMQQWQQAVQQIQAIEQSNQQKQQEFSAACALIKRDGVHGFKIDIEADSTIAPDEQAEKAARTEFLGKFVPLMEQVIPIAQGNPAVAAMAKEIALFGVRGFPVARSLEETIEKAFDAIAQMPPHPSQQGKGPTGKSPQELALDNREVDTRLQIARETNAVKLANIQQDREADAEKLASDQERDRTRIALETQRGARQDALAGVRMTHIEARDAGHLA